MRILLTNDDGFNAPGLESLKKIALKITSEDRIFVVAPSKNQSAKSRSITYKTSFEILKKNSNEYLVDGTPTDCVIFALDHLMRQRRPDIILSGVNWGYNLAEDVFYSGTIAAALEGAERGVLSIALSQAYKNSKRKKNSFLFAENCGAKLCMSIYEKFSLFNNKLAFNVNFPIVSHSSYPNCVKVSPVGKRHHSNFIIGAKLISENLFTAQIDSCPSNIGISSDDDYTNCLNGWVTISPISMMVQNENHLKNLMKVKF